MINEISLVYLNGVAGFYYDQKTSCILNNFYEKYSIAFL